MAGILLGLESGYIRCICLWMAFPMVNGYADAPSVLAAEVREYPRTPADALHASLGSKRGLCGLWRVVTVWICCT